MDRKQANVVEEALFSFTYSNRTQASRCNSIIHQRYLYSLEDELEEAFDEVDSSGLQLELGKIEIDLGRITERELNEDLGELIKPLLISALKEAIEEKINFSGTPLGGTSYSQGEEFILLALRSFFRNGYFPSWLDSKYDLFSLLEYAISFQAEILRSLVWEVSRKSENARKRISFLKKGYFEKIVEVMIPEEAEWLIGFRNTYLNVHQKEKSFQGSRENLEHAVNLFIINFIVRNSDTKFNRLNFSNLFLRAIAAHYHLDFHEFLLHLNRVLKSYKEESQLYRNFDEAVTWVIEKSNVNDGIEYSTLNESEDELISWFNRKQFHDSSDLTSEQVEVKRHQILLLISKNPQKLRGLSKEGFENLLQLLSNGKAQQWIGLLNEYSSWLARATNGSKMQGDTLLKVLFEHSSKEAVSSFAVSPSLDKLFEMMADFTSSQNKYSKVVWEELVDLGKRFFVSQSSLRLLKSRVFHQSDSTIRSSNWDNDDLNQTYSNYYSETESIGSYSFQLKQSLIFDYLTKGSVEENFYFLTKDDLSQILEELIQSKNSSFFELIKNSEGKILASSNSRFWKILDSNQSQRFLEYIAHFSGSRFNSLLQIHKDLLDTAHIKESNRDRLNQKFIQVLIAQGLFSSNSSLLDGSNISIDWSEYLQEFRKIAPIPDSVENSNPRWTRILHLATQTPRIYQLKPEFRKRLLDLLKQSLQIGRGSGFLDLKGNLGSYFSNREWNSKQIKAQKFSLIEAKVSLKSLIDNIQGLSISQEQNLIQWIESKAEELLSKDLNSIQKFVQSGYILGIQIDKIKESIQRVFRYSKIDAQYLWKFLKINRSQSISILLEFRRNLGENEWKSFALVLGSEFKRDVQILEGFLDFESLLKEERKWEEGDLFSSQKDFSLSFERILQLLEKGFKKNDLNKQLEQEKEFYLGLGLLADLPNMYFFEPVASRVWKKLISDSSLQFHSLYKVDRIFRPDDFGQILMGFLTKNRSYLRLDSMDWDGILSIKGLTTVQKVVLSQFYQSLMKDSKDKQDQSIESLISVLAFFEQEGFLPWWSNWRSVESLFTSTIHMITYGSKERSMFLIDFLANSNKDLWLKEIPAADFEKLMGRLSSASSSNQLIALAQEFREKWNQKKLEALDKKKEPNQEHNENSILNLSDSDLEREVKRKVSYSRELELIKIWFGSDSKIQDQVKEILGWNKEFYFGSLNPGKWKLLVLEFAYGYYFKQKNSYNPEFLKLLMQFLLSQKSSVKWKFVLGILMKRRSFLNRLNQKQQNILQHIFPENSNVMQEEPEEGDQISVTNAGLVLCWPFLKVLFSRLNVSEGNTIPVENQSKAVYLLQQLVYGHTDFPEYELVLNKMMVGMKPSTHLEETVLIQEEKDMCESLLKGMLSNWEKLKNSTPDALRETFLQRSGMLEIGSESNILKVEPKGVDVLMGSISWSYSVVKLPWMEKSLEVKWN